MITPQQYLDLIGKEFAIIRHLAAKLQDSDMEYRPSSAQRSTLELLQYISMLFDTSAEAFVTGNTSIWAQRHETSKSLTLAEFDSTMGAQELAFHAWFNQLSSEQLAEEVDFWSVAPRSVHFMNALRWASAYKMQLFLYMKSMGYSELNTMNAWVGLDGEM
jgi:hypothetical protein